MADGKAKANPRFRQWAVVTSALLVAALVVAIVSGLVLAHKGGQTPMESYFLTAVLAVLSIAGAWIVAVLMYQSQSHDRQIAERRQQEDIERTARSAVTRSFRIMKIMARIESHTDDEANQTVAELRTRIRVIREATTVAFDQTYDAIQDWRRFAPTVVDDEITKAENASIRKGEGWNE
ncbi:hypothetical protein [Mycobacterium sp.]|uniref:hypothetical protein n=1 Tax=Mycobacterium sp. TaxID=1785 RepID=UPI003D09A9DA